MDEKYISKYETGAAVDRALDYGTQAMYEVETAKGSTHETLDGRFNDLQEQIDQIVRAPESGGDVAAEVAQARVDSKGVSHSTLKNREDSEYAILEGLINDLDNSILTRSDNLYIDGYTEKVNGYLATSDATVLTPSSGYYTLKVRVKGSTSYTITHQRHWGGFFDTNGNKLGYFGGSSQDFYDYTVTTPINTAYMWVVVPVSETLSAFMVVEGETMSATYKKGIIGLQKYITVSQSAPILNIDRTKYIAFDIGTNVISIPTCSVLYSNTGVAFSARTIDLTQTETQNSCWALLYDYDTNDIIASFWKGPFNYPVIGVVYGKKLYINGILESQIKMLNNGDPVPTPITQGTPMLNIDTTKYITFDYANKTISIPTSSILYASSGKAFSARTIDLTQTETQNSCWALLYDYDTNDIIASFWKGPFNYPVIGVVYGKKLYINGILESQIRVLSDNSTVCFFGDSITAGVHTSKVYHMYWSEWADFSCKNYGIGTTGYKRAYSGSALAGEGVEGVGHTTTQTGNNTILDVMQTVSSIPRCVIFGGTNDFGNSENINDFRTAVQNTLDYALTKTTYILVITPIQRTEYRTRINNVGKKLSDYTDVIKEECSSRGIYCVDGIDVPLNPDSASYKEEFIPDGLHPNPTGHNMLARKLYNDFLTTMAN